jgi:porphobilinogen synthase
MPGVFNLSIDEAVKEAAECAALGHRRAAALRAAGEKDEQARARGIQTGSRSGAAGNEGDRRLDSLVTIADVCLCEYTSHGHCGV